MKFKKILYIFLWFVFAAGFFVLVGFVEVEQQKTVCKGIIITLDQGDENSFITKEEIRKSIYQLMGDSAAGKPMKEISISLIRERLEENEYVKKAIAYATVDGWIYIEISQRTPIIRVQNLNGTNFYLSDDGRMIPVSFQHSARVPFCNGFITEAYEPSRDLVPAENNLTDIDAKITTLQKLYLLGKYLKQDTFLEAQTEQIYVEKAGELNMIPLVGNHIVHLGNANDLTEKMEKLNRFYQLGLGTKGWNTYKTINIEFKNQVICSKN